MAAGWPELGRNSGQVPADGGAVQLGAHGIASVLAPFAPLT